MVHAERTLVFDAVGTLIRPRDSISETYRAAAMKWGLALPRSEIKARFQANRNLFFDNGTVQPSSNELERQCWRNLVANVFPEIPDTAELFQHLWEHYAEARHWILFPDVEACLHSYEQLGHTIVIASNFDDRLLPICEKLLPTIDKEHIFCSADLGFRKPDPRFYQSIQQRLEGVLIRPVMIGDDLEKDVLAARNAGWDAVHLDRQIQSLIELLSIIP